MAIDVAHNEKPDLILLDIFIPKMDGYTACCALKEDEATRAIPVIMISGEGLQLDGKFTLKLGADGYMTKPLILKELADMIGRLLKSRQ
jgi:CheY-like chemotaxis protein